jgi:Tol biopolymer transport system component
MRMRRAPLVAVALAIVVGAAGAATAPGSSGVAPPAGQIVFASTRATASPGVLYALAPGVAPRALSPRAFTATGLAASPRGRAYALWSNRSGPFRLMISPRGGSTLRTVVIPGRAGADLRYQSWAPVFSPDGTRLLIPYTPASSVAGRLRFALADVRSGPAKPLSLPCGETPLWSPDGLLVACTDFRIKRVFVADLAGHVRFSAPGTVVSWSADGRLAVAGTARTAIMTSQGHLLQQFAGVAREWSPDGRYLALTRGRSLVLAQPGRGADRVLATGPAGVQYYWMAFTPDGHDIGYEGGTDPPELAPVAGGPARQLVAGFGAVWSPDDRLAFSVLKGATATVEIGDRLGRHARVVARLPYDDHDIFTLAWLGDGSRLLSNVGTRDHADLWTMNADGATQSRLTATGDRIGEPAWSSDGTRLAYDDASFSGGNCGYCGGSVAIAAANGRKLALVPGESAGEQSSEGSPTWSPSGTQLAVSDDFSGGVYVTGLDGSGRAQIAQDPALAPAWSPDGGTVAYIDASSGSIWGVAPTGGAARRLLPASKLKALSVAWSPDGGLLAFSTTTGIFVAPADGSGVPRRIAAIRGSPNHARISFSPDGQWIAFPMLAGSVHPYTAISVVAIDGSGLRQLTKGPFDSFDPAWRPAPAPVPQS